MVKLTLTVAQATATVSVSGVLSGSSIIFTATATGSGSITPTGNVTWSVNHGTCSPSPATMSGGQASCTVSSVSRSLSYTATATYNGDSNYNGGATGQNLSGVQG